MWLSRLQGAAAPFASLTVLAKATLRMEEKLHSQHVDPTRCLLFSNFVFVAGRLPLSVRRRAKLSSDLGVLMQRSLMDGRQHEQVHDDAQPCHGRS